MKYQLLYFIPKTFREPVFLGEFSKLIHGSITNRMREINSHLYDTSFEIQDLVEREMQLIKKRNQERIRTLVTQEQKKTMLDLD